MIAELGNHQSDGRPLVQVEDREEWRSWLAGNHEEASGVWLVSWKKATGRPFVAYTDAVDEALCFGWVDSRPNKLDESRAMRLFTPRNPKSPWSRINKAKVHRLTERGRMAPAGMRSVEAAKANGAWTVYDKIEDLVIPPDLASALDGNDEAMAYFKNFPESSQKNILWWIKTAVKSETRAARVSATVELAAQNRMANHPKGSDIGPARASKGRQR